MGGGELPTGPTEPSQQQERASTVEPSRVSEDGGPTLEEQLKALQDRLDEQTARRIEVEMENVRLHRLLANEVERRQALEEPLRTVARPASPFEAPPLTQGGRRIGPRQGLVSSPSPLFGPPLEQRPEETADNEPSSPPLPRNGLSNGGVQLEQGAAPRPPPATQGEEEIPTPPQEVPARREGGGVPRNLQGSFERAGGAGVTRELSLGLLERLSQESDAREQAQMRGLKHEPADADTLETNGQGLDKGGVNGAPNSRGRLSDAGLDRGLGNRLGDDSGARIDGLHRHRLRLDAEDRAGGNVQHGLDRPSGNGADEGERPAPLARERDPPTDEEVKQCVLEILRGCDVRSVTARQVRRSAEERLGTSLYTRRQLIATVIDDYVEALPVERVRVAGAQVAEEPGDDEDSIATQVHDDGGEGPEVLGGVNSKATAVDAQASAQAPQVGVRQRRPISPTGFAASEQPAYSEAQQVLGRQDAAANHVHASAQVLQGGVRLRRPISPTGFVPSEQPAYPDAQQVLGRQDAAANRVSASAQVLQGGVRLRRPVSPTGFVPCNLPAYAETEGVLGGMNRQDAQVPQGAVHFPRTFSPTGFLVNEQGVSQSVGGREQSQAGAWLGSMARQGPPPVIPIQGGDGRGGAGGGQPGEPLVCHKCGSNRVVELTTKNGPNKGKVFFKCEQCGKFLRWKEPPAAPNTPPRANGYMAPRPAAEYQGPAAPAGRGQKRPWEQGGRRTRCHCGGEGVEQITKKGSNAGRKYLKCGTCNAWLRWNDY